MICSKLADLIFSVLCVCLLASCGELLPPEFRSIATIAGSNGKLGEPFGIASKDREIYVSDGEAGKVFKINVAGSVVEFASGMHTPSAIAFAPNGDLIVADTGTHTIKSISPSGEVRTLAGVENQPGSNDGEALSASFNGPCGIAVEPAGKIFVSDTYNDRIRVIENGRVSTLAGGKRGFRDGIGTEAMFDTHLGITIWKGRLLVADSGNKRIRVVEPDGSVWTLAGNGDSELRDGLLSSATFVEPTAIAVDADGKIYIADGNAIRKIGGRVFPIVETIAGGWLGFRDGKPHSSRFNRPSGLAFDANGELFVTDSDNRVVRRISTQQKAQTAGTPIPQSAEEFRSAQPRRWPFDPPGAKRDIAGTLGEIRGEIVDENSQVRFHNGLDIAGSYGETAQFIRTEKVLDPNAAENFGTLRELIRMPTIGYIHLRLGRDDLNATWGDKRFHFEFNDYGIPTSVRVPRGAKFSAGEPIGTLNAMNHVHLIVGRTGFEMNALAALEFPGISDSIAPTVETISLFDETWSPIETKTTAGRIKLSGKTRIVVRTFDRMDGNPEGRRLGVYKLGYSLETQPTWTIVFDRMPSHDAAKFTYAKGSQSGATGETIFRYIVTNRVNDQGFSEGFFDASTLVPGNYSINVFASDFFGNVSKKEISVEVIK